MPVYEYRCKSCGCKFSRLVGVVAEPSPPACPECGSASAERLISRIAKPGSEDSIPDRLSDLAAMQPPDDPASAREWAQEVLNEIDEDPEQTFEDLIEPDVKEKTYDLDEGN